MVGFVNALKDLSVSGIKPGFHYPAIVVNDNDPKRLCRVQARVKDLMDNISDDHLPWAMPMAFYHSQGGEKASGSMSIPKLGHKIFIVFQSSDPYTPLYTNFTVTDNSRIPEAGGGDHPAQGMRLGDRIPGLTAAYHNALDTYNNPGASDSDRQTAIQRIHNSAPANSTSSINNLITTVANTQNDPNTLDNTREEEKQAGLSILAGNESRSIVKKAVDTTLHPESTDEEKEEARASAIKYTNLDSLEMGAKFDEVIDKFQTGAEDRQDAYLNLLDTAQTDNYLGKDDYTRNYPDIHVVWRFDTGAVFRYDSKKRLLYLSTSVDPISNNGSEVTQDQVRVRAASLQKQHNAKPDRENDMSNAEALAAAQGELSQKNNSINLIVEGNTYTHIKGSSFTTIDGDLKLNVKGSMRYVIGKDDAIELEPEYTYGPDSIPGIPDDYQDIEQIPEPYNPQGNWDIDVTENVTFDIGNNYYQDVGEKKVIKIGSSYFVYVGKYEIRLIKYASVELDGVLKVILAPLVLINSGLGIMTGVAASQGKDKFPDTDQVGSLSNSEKASSGRGSGAIGAPAGYTDPSDDFEVNTSSMKSKLFDKFQNQLDDNGETKIDPQ